MPDHLPALFAVIGATGQQVPAHQADFEATKRIDPGVLDLTRWLRSQR